MNSLTPHGLAEAIESARFAALRQGNWNELREGERTTRVEILRTAMDASGVTERLRALEERADQSSELADLIERRDADFKRRLALDDAEIVRLGDTIATLTSQLATVTTERSEATRLAAELTSQLATVTTERNEATQLAAESVEKLTAIRDVLEVVRTPAPPAEVPPQPHTPALQAATADRVAQRRGVMSFLRVATGT